MNNFFEQFKSEGQKIRLSHAEKSAMKARILGVPSSVVTHSPYFFFNFQFSRTFVPVMAVLIVLFGTGTAYAAQGSLPGDVLYPVKIHVTEPVEVALAGTPADKAVVETKLAERRVAEAQTLASQGKLDATTTAELQSDFKVHEANAIALANAADNAEPQADGASTTTSTTTTTTTVVVTVAVAPAAAPKAMSAMRVTEQILPATTTSTTTTATGTSTPMPGAAVRGGLRERLQSSLNAQASILNMLQVDVEQHSDLERAHRHATTTRSD
ncbi:MAG: DUF5667 domain-containing protein [Patescibacteria group bacterium]